MGALEDEFVDDAVDADGAADEFHLDVLGVLEDEVVAVEGGEFLTADTTGELRRLDVSVVLCVGGGVCVRGQWLTVGTWLT